MYINDHHKTDQKLRECATTIENMAKKYDDYGYTFGLVTQAIRIAAEWHARKANKQKTYMTSNKVSQILSQAIEKLCTVHGSVSTNRWIESINEDLAKVNNWHQVEHQHLLNELDRFYGTVSRSNPIPKINIPA